MQIKFSLQNTMLPQNTALFHLKKKPKKNKLYSERKS